MSDLNDFFAKKDRKKKRVAAAKSQQLAATVTQESGGQSDVPKAETNLRGNGAAQPTSQPDDGWIEIEDPRGSQVNTGGRTVAEFRRDAEEKDSSGENATQTEKFSGWAKADAPAPAAEDGEKKAAPVARASTSAYPSLADAAKVHIVAPNQSYAAAAADSSYGSQSSSMAGRTRPRFIVDKEKLRQKLAEREAAAKSGV